MKPEGQVVRGLEGIVSHVTALSEVDGTAGRLAIRGFDIHELVGAVSFEEAAFLLWSGELPNRKQLAEVRATMSAARHVPSQVIDMLRGPGLMASGMHALRMGAAALSLDDPSADDLSPEAGLAQAIRITARMPALVAHHYRLRNRQKLVEPPDDLGFAAGYLYMLEGKEPDLARAEALDAYMVAVIEHGMNASTFTARVITSTNSDMVSSITGAIGALKGPLHGGVPGPVLDMLQEIGSSDRAEEWVRAALARGERIMGFGHRIYKVRDPRAEVLENAAERLAKVTGNFELLHLTRAVEEVTVKVLGEKKPGHHLYANTELYAALVLHGVNIPSEIFTPTFTIARTAGWTAHILEQRRDNRLIRPQSIYDGPRERRLVPLEAR